MEDRNLSEKESLALITQMIHTARNTFLDTGIGPILWGTVITFCSLVQVAQIHYGFELPFDVWLLTIAAILPQIYISIQERKIQKVRGWTDQALSTVWICFGIGIFIINFISTTYAKQLAPVLREYESLTGKSVGNLHFWNYGTAYLLFLYGVPTIITAAARNFRIMMIGGVVCWVSSVASVFTDIRVDFLLFALSAITAWLIPGIIIRRGFLKQRRKADV
jgi:hypothetical protein